MVGCNLKERGVVEKIHGAEQMIYYIRLEDTLYDDGNVVWLLKDWVASIQDAELILTMYYRESNGNVVFVLWTVNCGSFVRNSPISPQSADAPMWMAFPS